MAPELGEHPRLSDAGISSYRDHVPVRGANATHAAVRYVLGAFEEGPQLAVSADVRQRESLARFSRGRPMELWAQEAVDGHRLGLAFEGYRCKRLELERFCGQPKGRWTDQDLAGLRRTLQPRGDVHGVSHDGVVLTARGTDASGHNKSGIHPNVQAQRSVISIIELANGEEAVETPARHGRRGARSPVEPRRAPFSRRR